MNHSTLRSLQVIVLCFILPSLPCGAARAMRTLFIAPGDSTLRNCVLVDGTQSRPVELPQRNLSAPIMLSDGDVVLYALPKALAEGEKIPATAPSARIPESWTRCILVFMPDPQNKVLPVTITPVDASDSKMPLGHTLLINCTKATLHAKFANETVTCMPARTVLVKPPRADHGDYPIAIDCTYPDDMIRRPVCRSTWNHNPTVRQFLFAIPDRYRKLPHIWGVNDLPQPTDPGAKPKEVVP